ncbi:DUF2834 domain-containing protein [Tenacibaculum sp. 190524A02b]|uniref:DUF2834 domain-containing protein n=1 Tax=Tenacibaculum vairaonense TaxID=3137860 RepID=A0ABM9PKW9_9FLAO
MRVRHLYLLIAILGTCIPYYHFGEFLFQNGIDFKLFIDQMTGTSISSFFTWDVIISTLAVFTLVLVEGKRIGMKNLWLYILFNLIVGVSLALPAFLYVRQKKLATKTHNSF